MAEEMVMAPHGSKIVHHVTVSPALVYRPRPLAAVALALTVCPGHPDESTEPEVIHVLLDMSGPGWAQLVEGLEKSLIEAMRQQILAQLREQSPPELWPFLGGSW